MKKIKKKTKCHMGHIIWKAIKKKKLNITKLAYNLKVSRNTLYNKFKSSFLDIDFLKKIDKITNLNFCKRFFNYQHSTLDIDEQKSKFFDSEAIYFSYKYYEVLEDYNILVTFLIKLSTMEKEHNIRKEIRKYIKKNNIKQF